MCARGELIARRVGWAGNLSEPGSTMREVWSGREDLPRQTGRRQWTWRPNRERASDSQGAPEQVNVGSGQLEDLCDLTPTPYRLAHFVGDHACLRGLEAVEGCGLKNDV